MPLGVKGYAYIKDATQKTIVVGTSNFTEVFILGYMYEDLIEHYTDFKVERRFNLNGADFCFSALTNGDIDTFVEYSGTALMNFCKISDEEMRNMNYAVDVEGRDAHEVAHEFLVQKGYFLNKKVIDKT